MNNGKSEITIILVSFYSKNLIARLISQIDLNINILVIENSNSEDCKRYLEEKFKNVKVILSKENLGNGGGINLGLKNTKTKYAFYLDIDVELNDGTILNLFYEILQTSFPTLLWVIILDIVAEGMA